MFYVSVNFHEEMTLVILYTKKKQNQCEQQTYLKISTDSIFFVQNITNAISSRNFADMRSMIVCILTIFSDYFKLFSYCF